MGLEYQLETYDAIRLAIPEFVRRQPEFLREDDGQFHLSIDGASVAVTVSHDDNHIQIIQHDSCRETDALFGLLIRHALSLNDHVVVSEM